MNWRAVFVLSAQDEFTHAAARKPRQLTPVERDMHNAALIAVGRSLLENAFGRTTEIGGPK